MKDTNNGYTFMRKSHDSILKYFGQSGCFYHRTMMIVAAFWKLIFIHSYFPTTHFHMQDFIKGKKSIKGICFL